MVEIRILIEEVVNIIVGKLIFPQHLLSIDDKQGNALPYHAVMQFSILQAYIFYKYADCSTRAEKDFIIALLAIFRVR